MIEKNESQIKYFMWINCGKVGENNFFTEDK